MGFEKGNSFWALRLTHGRYHEIATHTELWDNFVEYATWYEENPLTYTDWKGKYATPVTVEKIRIMSKEGFALACGLSGWDVIYGYKARSRDFMETITRIEQAIIQQKIQGAAADLLNAGFIAKEIGLKEQQEQTVNTVHSLGEDVKDEIAKLIKLNKK